MMWSTSCKVIARTSQLIVCPCVVRGLKRQPLRRAVVGRQRGGAVQGFSVDPVGLVDARPEAVEDMTHRGIVLEDPGILRFRDADLHRFAAESVQDQERGE